tara:strand:+ start:514 stop:723 length:210 start_codon:yes stop_codon:yes gene_type:complete
MDGKTTRRIQMGKIRDAAEDWLQDHGYELGYNWDNIPKITEWNNIKLNKIKARVYYGKDGARSNTKTRL